MKYFAYLQQERGCDYTIGCGNILLILKASNKEAAIQELKNEIEENFTEGSEYELTSILLIEGDLTKINLDLWYEEFHIKNKNEELKQKEKEEKLLYEKLKTKFEKEKE
jgi:hypothetical protein